MPRWIISPLESTATPSEVLSERLHVQESARSAFATFLEANDEEANSRLDAHVSSELASLREWTLKMVRERLERRTCTKSGSTSNGPELPS